MEENVGRFKRGMFSDLSNMKVKLTFKLKLCERRRIL
jgi:hypothetical protein